MTDIIDLDTGELVSKKDQPEPVQPTQPAAQAPAQIINLDTGKLEAKAEAPAPTVDDFIMKDAPAEMLTQLTPEEAAELPEIGYLENKLLSESLKKDGNFAKSFKLAVGNLVSSEPAQQIEIIQNILPEAKIRTMESGETIVDYEGQKYIMNKKGASAADVTRLAGQFVAFLPTGTAAKLGRNAVQRTAAINALKPLANSAAKQRLGQVAAAASASAGISAGLDVAASGMAGDESTQGISKERAALSAIFGGGAELLGPAFRSVVGKFRGTPDDLKYINLDEVKLLREAQEKTGITLFEPQATQARADSVYMRILQELPETQQQMASKLFQQNEEAAAAVTNYLARIGDAKSASVAPAQIKQVATDAIDAMKEARSNLVRQGYQEAFAAGDVVDVSPVLSNIDAMLSKVPSGGSNPVRTVLENAKNLIASDAKVVREPKGVFDGRKVEAGALNDLEILHNAKITISDEIERLMASGKNSAARNLTIVNQQLTGLLEEASPMYDQVKSIYREASGPIEQLESSLIGKVARIKDDNLKRVLPAIFDASESNPAALKNARSIIESQNPEAWQNLTRAYLESQLGKISTRAVEGVPNTPIMLNQALFGKNEVQRRMILDALTPEQAGNARWLEMTLKAAARGRKQGSDTAGKTEAIRQIKEGPITKFFSPIKGLTDAMNQSRFERRASAFVEAMTDGKWSEEMMKLKQMRPTDSASSRALIQLLNRIESEGVDSEPRPAQSAIKLPEIN